MKKVRVRIAPSPTGEDLHIGNVYTAIINFVFAKKYKGKFIVRIEDTDRDRIVKEGEKRILQSLSWLGLAYDEGPDIGGPYAPYRQSERLDLYRKYAQTLVKKGHAYYCFCSPERLEQMRSNQQKKGFPTFYDGKCKKKVKSQKGNFVIRLNVPEEGKTEFNDTIRGKISFENKLIDDQVLLKSDGYPTYHLAVVVDDHLMKISHIIRAEEWISSTPKHVLIYKFLGWSLPIFVHGPILRNPDKSKLSKRKNPVWVSWYKQKGFLPKAILNYLALMGWSMPDEREIFSIPDMIKHFRLKDIKPVGPIFDLNKLEWLNGEYIRKFKVKSLKLKVLDFIGKNYPQGIVEKTIPLVQERIKKLSDYLPMCEFFFNRPCNWEIDLSAEKKSLEKMHQELKKTSPWKAAIIGKKMQTLAQKLGISNSKFFMILRVAVSGKRITPPLNESMEVLGKKEVLARLQSILSS